MQNQNQNQKNGCIANLYAPGGKQLKSLPDGLYKAEPGSEFSIEVENKRAKQQFLVTAQVANDPITGSETTGMLVDPNSNRSIKNWLHGSQGPLAFFTDAKGQMKQAKAGSVFVNFYTVVEKTDGQKTSTMTARINKTSTKSVQVLDKPEATIELRYANPTEWDRMQQASLAASGSSSSRSTR